MDGIARGPQNIVLTVLIVLIVYELSVLLPKEVFMTHDLPSRTSIRIDDYEIDATFSEERNVQAYNHVKQILISAFANSLSQQ